MNDQKTTTSINLKDSNDMLDSLGVIFRVKKTSDDTIHGPVDLTKLKQLAQTAMIAPDDFVDMDNEVWVPAPEIPSLEMHWIIHATDGTKYGPTTLGTIREFQSAGEVMLEDIVEDVRTKEEKTVKEVIGSRPAPSLIIEAREESATQESDKADAGNLQENPEEEEDQYETKPHIPIPQNELVIPPDASTIGEEPPTLTDYEANLEMARELKIRQLECDLEQLHKDYNELQQKYRQLMELVQTHEQSH